MDFRITADYHSHTTYSHGKGSIADNALAASQKGLEILAITDHAVRHPFIGVSPKKYDAIRKDLQQVQSNYPNLELLMGIEANVLGADRGRRQEIGYTYCGLSFDVFSLQICRLF